jgi:hypothetical protein
MNGICGTARASARALVENVSVTSIATNALESK